MFYDAFILSVTVVPFNNYKALKVRQTRNSSDDFFLSLEIIVSAIQRGCEGFGVKDNAIVETFSHYLCDVSTMERPPCIVLVRIFQRKRRATGSIPVVGSSCKANLTLLAMQVYYLAM